MSLAARSSWLGASAFGARAVVGVFIFGYVLVPDTFSYASGGSAWSSPLASLVGLLAGFRGEQILGVVGACALGYVVAFRAPSRGWWLRVSACYLLSPGYAGMAASPDAAGAAAAAAAVDVGRVRLIELFRLVVVSFVHLEAGFVLAATLVGRRVGLSPALVAPLACVLACVAEWHVQARYLVPGLAIAAVTA